MKEEDDVTQCSIGGSSVFLFKNWTKEKEKRRDELVRAHLRDWREKTEVELQTFFDERNPIITRRNQLLYSIKEKKRNIEIYREKIRAAKNRVVSLRTENKKRLMFLRSGFAALSRLPKIDLNPLIRRNTKLKQLRVLLRVTCLKKTANVLRSHQIDCKTKMIGPHRNILIDDKGKFTSELKEAWERLVRLATSLYHLLASESPKKSPFIFSGGKSFIRQGDKSYQLDSVALSTRLHARQLLIVHLDHLTKNFQLSTEPHDGSLFAILNLFVPKE